MSDVLKVDAIEAKLREFIIENYLFGNEDNMVTSDSSFMENGIIDSLGILELIEYCEETYGIVIDDDELIPENLDTLDNLYAFIKKKQ